MRFGIGFVGVGINADTSLSVIRKACATVKMAIPVQQVIYELTVYGSIYLGKYMLRKASVEVLLSSLCR